ncbi:MAG: hypothetical protein PVJ49_14850 [Acidobacteriota bacterium]|jgi:hypothetical protein
MASREFLPVILLGALLAVPYCLYARQRRRPAQPFAAGLTVAAVVYVVFALARGAGPALPLELGGVLLFATLSVVGILWSPYLLSAGWLLHVAWDLEFHPIDHPGYAPSWYPVLCVGFDLVVAGCVFAVARIARESAT